MPDFIRKEDAADDHAATKAQPISSFDNVAGTYWGYWEACGWEVCRFTNMRWAEIDGFDCTPPDFYVRIPMPPTPS